MLRVTLNYAGFYDLLDVPPNWCFFGKIVHMYTVMFKIIQPSQVLLIKSLKRLNVLEHLNLQFLNGSNMKGSLTSTILYLIYNSNFVEKFKYLRLNAF